MRPFREQAAIIGRVPPIASRPRVSGDGRCWRFLQYSHPRWPFLQLWESAGSPMKRGLKC